MCGRVESFFFITDLRMATSIVAIVSLLVNVGVLAFTSWAVNYVRLRMEVLLAEGLFVVSFCSAALATLALVLLVSITGVVLDVVLFLGAYRCRRDLLQCWSQGHAVVCGTYLLYLWMLVVIVFSLGYILTGSILLIAYVIGAVLSVYFSVVVRSFDFNLKRMRLRTLSESCSPPSDNADKPPTSINFS